MIGDFFDKITIAVDGQEGLKKFKEDKFDLLITDLNMPNLSGMEMIDKIKNIDKSIPVIIFSANDQTSFYLDAINSGIDRYLIKPINFDDFLKYLC